MDQDLRSQLNVQLVAGGHDKKIQEQLLYSLNAQPNNWPTQIQARALTLLRSGDAHNFPSLLKQILEEVRKETALGPRQNAASSSAADGPANNGSSSSNSNSGSSNGNEVQVNGGGPTGKKAANGGGPGPGEASNLHQNTSTSLAVPQAVVDDALRVTREALMAVAEFEEDNGAT